MKKLLLCATLISAFLGMNLVYAVAPYFKAEAGVVGLGVLNGNSAGFRIGNEFKDWDLQVGYTRDDGGMDSGKLKSNGATISTISGELYKVFKYSNKLSLRAGGGLGFSSVDLEGPDKSDPGLSTIIGAEARWEMTKNLRVGLALKGQFLNVDTTRTDYGSHMETYYIDGVPSGQVEVVDEYPQANNLNLNSGKLLFTVVWMF